ncbi:MAG: PUA domain-containing protein [Nitrososphaera sp.]
MNPLPVDPVEKVRRHVDAIFGPGVSEALPKDMQFEFSRKTGRIKNFAIGGKLAATLRTDGGLALTMAGAQFLVNYSPQFKENCVIPVQEAVPFVTEGRSLFCRHVQWSGVNVHAGSDVAIIDGDNNNSVIAVGIAVMGHAVMNRYGRGVAVKVREGLKSRVP